MKVKQTPIKPKNKILVAMFAPWTGRKLWMTLIATFFLQQLFWTWVWYQYTFTEQWRAEMVANRYDALQNWIGIFFCSFLGLQTTQNIVELVKTKTLTNKIE